MDPFKAKSKMKIQYSIFPKSCSLFKQPRYRFGYNGMEKVNEWSGIGNHNTAKFWEYDTRTGRRLNLDPVIHYSLSPYAAFSLSPIWKVDPNGDDDYYNRKAKYLGTDGNGHRLRVVDNKDLQTASAFNNFMKLKMQKSKSLLNPPPLLLSNFRVLYSRPISFKNEGATFKQMYKAAKDGSERGAYIIFDANKAEVRLSKVNKGEKGTNEMEMLFQAGSNVFSTKDNEITILGDVHTHRQEEKYFKLGNTDKDLFESQYNKNLSDGKKAQNTGDNIYSIGKDNVNYYSPEGKEMSTNNASSRADLESGKSNIEKGALEKYGKQ